MSKLPKEIQSKILDVRTRGGTWLDLGHAGLTEIPKEVFNRSGLQELHLWRNQIRIVPERSPDH
jgi:hypothetical protein